MANEQNKAIYQTTPPRRNAAMFLQIRIPQVTADQALQGRDVIDQVCAKYGVPESSSLKRKAQAKQLKGYLLLFEQVMADFLENLQSSDISFHSFFIIALLFIYFTNIAG